MLQGEQSVILLTFIKLSFVIKIFVLSIFEWLLKTCFIVLTTSMYFLFCGVRRLIVRYIYLHAFLKKGRGHCNRLHQSVCLSVRASVCPLCYLLLNHWTKFNQNWCVSYSHEWGVYRQIFFGPTPWGPGEGQKVKYHLISITKTISKIFIPNFVCVFTNERYKTYQTGFSFCCLGHTQGVGLRGAGGAQGVKKIFFKHGHVAN